MHLIEKKHMAEIKVVKKSGNIKEEYNLSVLPDWATESTLHGMSKNVELTNKLLELQLTKGPETKVAEEIRALTETVENTAKQSDGRAKETDKNNNKGDKEKEKQEQKRFTETHSALQGLVSGLFSHNLDAASVVGSSLYVIREFSTELGNINHVLLGPMALALEGFAILMAGLIANSTEVDKQFVGLTENGITYGTSMRAIAAQADRTGLSLEEYSNILKKNAATTNYLGTKATSGLITQFNTLSKRGSEYGITQAEADDELLNYADTLRMTGMLQHRSTSDIVNLNDKYQRELGQVVALTGESRKQLEESVKKRFTDLDMQVALAALPDQIRENMLGKVLPAISGVFGERGADILQKPLIGYLARGMGGIGPEFANLLSTSGTFEAFQKIGEITKAGGDPTEALKEFGNKLSDPQMLASMSKFATLPGPIGDAARQMMELKMASENARKGLTADGKMTIEEDRKRRQAMEEFNTATNKMKTEFMKFAISATPAVISSLQILTGVVNALTGPMEGLSKIINTIGQLGGLIDKTAGNTQDKDGNFKNPLIHQIAQGAAGGAQLSALMVAGLGMRAALKHGGGFLKALLTRKKKGEPEVPELPDEPELPELPGAKRSSKNRADRLAAKGSQGLGGSLSSLGKGLGDLGKGLGGGISGLLKGVASGLAAFGNPETILGLAAVTLAINGLAFAMRIAAPAFEPFGRMMKLVFQGIGDGLASASVIITKIGDAVGMVIKSVGDSIVAVMHGAAQSLMTISTINPGKLYAVAPAIAAVGASLVPFGVGTAAAAAGGVLSSIARRFGGAGAASAATAAHTPQKIDLAAATAAHQKSMQDMTKQMVELLISCDHQLKVLNHQTDTGHDRLITAVKKSGQVY